MRIISFYVEHVNAVVHSTAAGPASQLAGRWTTSQAILHSTETILHSTGTILLILRDAERDSKNSNPSWFESLDCAENAESHIQNSNFLV